MQNFIHCSGLYNNIDQLHMLMSSMEFEGAIFGEEIINFNYVPADLEDYFKHEINSNITIQQGTGIFRKSSDIIHVEQFFQHSMWLVIVAMEDTLLTIYEQDTVKTVFDVIDNLDEFIVDNCYDASKWLTVNTIKLKKNDYIYIRPWIWYSLDPNKLTQLFLLNTVLLE
jgi:hypothetical protein